MVVSELLEQFPQLAPADEWRNELAERVEEFRNIKFTGSRSFLRKAEATKSALVTMLQAPEAWMTVEGTSRQTPFRTATAFYKEVRLRAKKTKAKSPMPSKQELPEDELSEHERLLIVEQSLRQSIVHVGAWNLGREIVKYLSEVEQSEALSEERAAEGLAFRAASFLLSCRLGKSRTLSTFPMALEDLIVRVPSVARADTLMRARKIVALLADFEPRQVAAPPEVNVIKRGFEPSSHLPRNH